MKDFKYLAAASLLIVGCAVSYSFGYNDSENIKDYEAACILSDICRIYMDSHDDNGEFEELYYDVLDNLDCYNTHLTKEELQNNYAWCY